MTEQYRPFIVEKLHGFSSRPVNGHDQTEFVDVILRPYGEYQMFYVAWEVKPKNSDHGILRLEISIEPKGHNIFNYRIIAQHVDSSNGVPIVPPGVMLRGESGHSNIPPGTEVQIKLWGDVQISEQEKKAYSYCRIVTSGTDELKPCL